MLPRKVVVILYGPPGSGKGTQANLLADKLDIVHFDTGKFMEAAVHDPKRQKEAVIRRERKLFDSGILMTPSFVVREVQKHAERIRKNDSGIVFSGSPRTIYETERLTPFLEKLYGKKNIRVFVLDIPEAVSLRRNSRRLICTVCKSPLLTSYYPSSKPKYCPICAGTFYRRTVDKPAVIKVRLKQYRERTKPIFSFMKKRGYPVRTIDGKLPPFKVFEKIYVQLKKSARN